ncbi:MAG: DNA alkylation repair protein [Ignavibacteriales bacterium]|nr:DNA alkylation repair protein [Ignavibacteriales bacterium]
MELEQVLKWIKSNANPKAVEGMARFAISSPIIYGVTINKLRPFAKLIGKNHRLSLELWKTKIHEARLLATMIDEPDKVTEKQMEKWVKEFKSWDICDQCCSNLFDKTSFAYQKAFEWSEREEEFVKRAGFVLMATLSIHNKKDDDKEFEKFFPIIIREATDERNFVRKAVNWALRQIGKRSVFLNQKAIEVANQILTIDSKSAKWIAKDALKELTNEKILRRIFARK